MMRALMLIAGLATAANAVAFDVARVIVPARVVLPLDKPQQVAIDVAIEPGYHVQANPAAYPNLIPIELSFVPAQGVTVGDPRYPGAKRLRLEGSGDQLLVYDGRFRIVVPMARHAPAAAPIRVEGRLRYQACDHKQCLFPQTVPLRLTVAPDVP
jgi:uncharacterized protein